MAGLVDTHCHLDALRFASRLTALARQARMAGVGGIISAGVSPADWPAQFRAAQAFSDQGVRVWHVIGTHPWWAKKVDIEKALSALKAVLQNPSHAVVGIGEIGLDFATTEIDAERQNKLFTGQLQVAYDHGLPVVLHERKSADRLLYWLRRRPHWGGVVHGFSGSLQQAYDFIEQGFAIGVGNAVTHPGAHRLHRMIKALPEEALLLETDAPNQPGHHHRGAHSRPAHLGENLQALAFVRQTDAQQLAATITENAVRVFGIHAEAQ